jgi:acetoacetyl-CoA synthetase
VADERNGDLLWSPPPDARDRSRVGAWLGWLERHRGRRFSGYADAWAWSVEDLEGFWSSVWEYFEVSSSSPYESVLADAAMPGAVWFPGARLNYAEHALRRRGPETAIISESQTREPVSWSFEELSGQVARIRAGLVRLGVGRGDRVAAYLPNIAETAAAFLATASLGAVWSSCAPEFGPRAVLDRLRQIEPKVLLTVDGYRYGERVVDRASEVAGIREALPGLVATVVLPYLDPDPGRVPGALAWDEFASDPGGASEPAFEPVPFDHPLYVLYSSGTTGLPKAIVHGHGGILVEHLKVLSLHHDLGPGDRFFWFSTTGWMMWNFLVSGLLVGATVVCFDGDPASPDLGTLWRLAGRTGVTYFGTSASFLMACRKSGVAPRELSDLSALRGVGSTAAPLPAAGFRYAYEALGPELFLSSISGGTDMCTAFVAGSPLVPVWAGEISSRALGAKVESFDPEGRPLVGREGELVVTAPMPSMPVGFWGDPDGSRYRDAYFSRYPGVWHHGDWLTITERGSCIITGRSDATLNRGGVRLGTSEFYAVIESLDEISDSLVVHLEDRGGPNGLLLLLVVMAPGAELDDVLAERIRTALRRDLSPRHVPDEIRAVPVVPRTLSGKKLEVPAKRILGGTPPDVAASRGSLADPEALDVLERLAREWFPP